MEQDQQVGTRFLFGDFVLDVSEAKLTRNGKPVPLAPKEFELLHVLVSRAGHLVYKENLIRSVWPDTFVSDSSLLRNISVLRQQLGHDAIRTVPKRGYVFAFLVSQLDYPGENASVDHSVVSGPSQVLAVNGFSVQPHQIAEPDRSNLPNGGGAHPTVIRRTRIRLVVAIAGVVIFCLAGASLSWRRGSDHKLQEYAAATPRVAGAVQLFVLNQNEDSISIFNTFTNTVRSILLVRGNPRGAAISPNGDAVYVSLNGTNSVVALDTRTGRIAATIPVGNNPVGVAANPRPSFIYVANNYSNSVSVIDVMTNRVVRNIAVGRLPTEIAVTADGTRALVTNQAGGTVTVIDTISNTVLTTIPVGSTPVGIAFTPDSKFAWVTLAGQDEVAILDIGNETVVQRVRVGHGPVRVAISRDGRYALVSNFFSNLVTVVDTASLQPIRTITVGVNPVAIALNAPGDLVYVANYGSDTVSVIDMNKLSVIDTFRVGKNPEDIIALPCYTVPCNPTASDNKGRGN